LSELWKSLMMPADGAMNDLGRYARLFDALPPRTTSAPPGYLIDFLGSLIRKDFLREMSLLAGVQSRYAAALAAADPRLPVPALGDGGNAEPWFEAVNWIVAAREARGRFVMASLGTFFGYQAVGSHRALALLNPMPSTLICVEPLADKMAWLRRHLRDNGIDPDRQWLIETAVGADNAPVLFPVGAPEIGGHNCIATNDPQVRQGLLRALLLEGRPEQALTDLLLRNSTGLAKDVAPGGDFTAEIKFVSCVTLQDILGPFEFVDYIEADLQQSEIAVFPPYMDLLKRKVRRIHIGTHGTDVHARLHALFAEQGWAIVFSYQPNGTHESPFGPFTTNDGVLTVRNPDL
jgi:hypothetical protein